MNAASIIALILLFVALVVTIKLYGDEHPRPDFNPVRFMARVAIFGAMAAILYAVPVFHFTLPFLPSFLEFHFDEIPAFICGFAYGPVAAGCVIAVKTLIKLPFTSTMGAGELSDLILSCLYVIPAVIIYGKVRNLKGVAIGFGVATLIQVVAAMILNVYLLIPFYIYMMGFSEAGLLGLVQKAMPIVHDLKWSYAVIAVLPFNLIKDVLVVVATFLIYRSIHVFLHWGKPKTKKKAE
jgi:riboflavin transporter FmnP